MSYDNAYERLIARTYDAAYSVIRDPSGDAAFYQALARETGGPVLELGCGTGRVLIPIASDGIECVWLDASPQMLAVLRAKLPPANLSLVRPHPAGADRHLPLRGRAAGARGQRRHPAALVLSL
jgi:ubiquinone/menaquinone biosynthesis C-methylase UbiE